MKIAGRYSDAELLLAFRSAKPPDWAVRQLYVDCFDMASSIVLNNGGSVQDAEDIFQEALVTFIEMTADGRFRAESSISSFLYSLIRHRWLNELRRKGRAVKREQDYDSDNPGSTTEPGEALAQRELSQQVAKILDALGEPCKTILLGFYYENLSIREILAHVDFQNEQVLRNKKTKCMKQLMEMISSVNDVFSYFKSAFNHDR